MIQMRGFEIFVSKPGTLASWENYYGPNLPRTPLAEISRGVTSSTAPSWFTAAEIAQLGMPGLPDSTRRVHDWAAAEGWSERVAADGTALARPRRARGGGTEYHASLLPVAVQLALRSRIAPLTVAAPQPDAASHITERWAWFESRSTKVKAEANRRLSILREVDDHVAVGIGKGAAVTAIASAHGTSRSVIFDWFKMVGGPAGRRSAAVPCPSTQGRAKAHRDRRRALAGAPVGLPATVRSELRDVRATH